MKFIYITLIFVLGFVSFQHGDAQASYRRFLKVAPPQVQPQVNPQEIRQPLGRSVGLRPMQLKPRYTSVVGIPSQLPVNRPVTQAGRSVLVGNTVLQPGAAALRPQIQLGVPAVKPANPEARFFFGPSSWWGYDSYFYPHYDDYYFDAYEYPYLDEYYFPYYRSELTPAVVPAPAGVPNAN